MRFSTAVNFTSTWQLLVGKCTQWSSAISFSETEAGTLMMLAWDATVVPVLLQEK